jgi:hypothetical protein
MNPQNPERFLNNRPISLFSAAKELMSLVKSNSQLAISKNDNTSDEAIFVKTAQAILLNEYDTYWFPIIDSRNS